MYTKDMNNNTNNSVQFVSANTLMGQDDNGFNFTVLGAVKLVLGMVAVGTVFFAMHLAVRMNELNAMLGL
jgi:hypothetical protein